jgi:hypothetical protein
MWASTSAAASSFTRRTRRRREDLEPLRVLVRLDVRRGPPALRRTLGAGGRGLRLSTEANSTSSTSASIKGMPRPLSASSAAIDPERRPKASAVGDFDVHARSPPRSPRPRRVPRCALDRVRECLRCGQLEVESGICCEVTRLAHASRAPSQLRCGLGLVAEPEANGAFLWS